MKMSNKAFVGISIAVVTLVAGFYFVTKQPSSIAVEERTLADVSVPNLSLKASAGKLAFDASCASCHGPNAAGQEGIAPPLVHIIYEPNHHGDMSFVRAAKKGVRAHHWPFGNMPSVKGVSDNDLEAIITYVRELQRANGIH